MNTFAICRHAASGCDFPAGECLGLCLCNKWEDWSGGECPLPPSALVEYKMRGGLTSTRGTRADTVRWSHIGSAGDVVAYRKKAANNA